MSDLDHNLAILGVPLSSTIIAFPEKGAPIVVKTVKGRPAPRISLSVKEKGLTGYPKQVNLSLASPMKGESLEREEENMANEKKSNGTAPAFVLSAPEGVDTDVTSKAADRIAEYQKTIMQESFCDILDDYLKREDASPLGLAGLVTKLVQDNGEAALVALNRPIKDFIKVAAPRVHREASSGGDSEKAIELSPMEAAKLDESILGATQAERLTLGKLVEVVGYNSPTISKRVKSLMESGKLSKEGEKRATRYFNSETQPALPGTEAAPATV